LWVSSDIDYDNLDVLNEYVVSPLPAIINPDLELIDGWTYIATDVNFTGVLSNSTSISPWYSYEISYPAGTPVSPGCYGAVYQNFITDAALCPATVVIAFNVRDSYTGDSGVLVKQVLLNEEVIWEDAVAGDERWQHVKVPVTLRSATNKLTLRVYVERASSNFPIQVWWDDVDIEPITAVAEKIPTAFYILDTEGTEENYPTDLYLGEPVEFLIGVENNEHEQVNYVLKIKLDDRLIAKKSKQLEHGSKWARVISVTPDKLGDNQKLEFLLFKDSTLGKPYRYFHLRVSTGINYGDLEPLLRYGIEPLPTVVDGNMKRISAWTFDREGRFSGYRSTENASSQYSYCIAQQEASKKGEYGELWQTIYAGDEGVAVLSVNVRDSFEYTSDDAENITKQVLFNDEVIWSDDVSGKDTGYTGWVEEEYNWYLDEWKIKSVPRVKSGWKRIDVPVYLFKGAENTLRLKVVADEATEDINVKVYWDDVELKRINELVKVEDGVRMKRYGW
ncbi:MAG: DUF1616 domain-containing protein, partial [Methanosarcinales archaeon]|nr:DUF1616 domain-containing protein [Methanosarcinales archaeon]